MAFYNKLANNELTALFDALDSDFEKKLDAIELPTAPRKIDADFYQKAIAGEPKTRAGILATEPAIKAPLPTFSTAAAWRQKIAMVKTLGQSKTGQAILNNPFLSYIFLRSTDNANFQNIIQKTPLWRLVFK